MSRDITATRNRTILSIVLAVVAQIAVVAAFVAQSALAIRTINEAGMIHAELSDVGILIVASTYSPIWSLISTGILCGGVVLFFSFMVFLAKR